MAVSSMMRYRVMRSRPLFYARLMLRRVNLKYVKQVHFHKVLDDQGPWESEPVGIRYTAIDLRNANDLIIVEQMVPRGIALGLIKRLSRRKYDKDVSLLKEEIWNRLSEGEVCLIQSVDDETSGHIWLTSNGSRYEPSIEQYVPIQSGEVLLSSLIIYPRFRKMGCGKRLVRQALNHLGQMRNVMAVQALVENDNLASKEIFFSLGFKPIRTIRILRILWIKNVTELRP